MATISRRGPKQWRAQVRRKGIPAQSKTFESRAEAEKWARSIESAVDRGTFQDMREAETTALREVIERYRREITPSKKGAIQESRRLAQWLADPLANRPLANLRSSDFAAWRDSRLEYGRAASTVRNDLNVISSIFETARKEWGFDGLKNPVKPISKPKLPKGRDRRLVGDEEERLIRAAENYPNAWVCAAIKLAIATAMRQGEILGLNWQQVDLQKCVLHLLDTKNGDRRDVPLSTRAVIILDSLPRHIDGMVFPLEVSTLQAAWKRILGKARIENLRFHDLRHEATSQLFEMGLDVMEVSSITGHKTLNMLKRYTHLKAENLAKKLG